MGVVDYRLIVGVDIPLKQQNVLSRRLNEFLSFVFLLEGEPDKPALRCLAQNAVEGPRRHAKRVGLQLSSVYPVPAKPTFHQRAADDRVAHRPAEPEFYRRRRAEFPCLFDSEETHSAKRGHVFSIFVAGAMLHHWYAGSVLGTFYAIALLNFLVHLIVFLFLVLKTINRPSRWMQMYSSVSSTERYDHCSGGQS